jgi:hypothetical protein
MPLTSRWGSSATTVSRIDWTCDSNNTKPRPLNHSCVSGTACPPLSGPTGISANIPAPANGPTGISASLAPPANGPTGISASVGLPIPPVSGPTGISASIAQFNVGSCTTNQAAIVATAPAVGTIKYAGDVEALFIFDGTDWQHYKSDG